MKIKFVFGFFKKKIFLKSLLFQEELSEMWSKMCIGLHVKYRLLLLDFNET